MWERAVSGTVRMVADRHRRAIYHSNHCYELSGGTNIDDLE